VYRTWAPWNFSTIWWVVPICFDSGAECSFIKEAVSLKLSGSRINNVVILRGIGSNTVCSNLQILAKVLICDHSFDVLFHAVQDSYIKYDALKGREILSQGIGVTITSNSLSMFFRLSFTPTQVLMVTEPFYCIGSRTRLEWSSISAKGLPPPNHATTHTSWKRSQYMSPLFPSLLALSSIYGVYGL